jgi:fructose/tagatose bisphosphate aldolase
MSSQMGNLEIESMVRDMVFGSENKSKQRQIRSLAQSSGIFPASIQSLYEAIGAGSYRGFTVPAINIRGITFDVARAVFRAAIKNKVGPIIFELARSEMAYTLQSPGEYTACVMAAAMIEGYSGPVFLQGDHIQIRQKNFDTDPDKEMNFVKSLVKECVDAGFYNIDIDASTLVNIEKADLLDQQAVNGQITAEMTRFIRSIEPKGVTISIGGEIGEIGAGNSTVGDLMAFMEMYQQDLDPSIKQISKISVQTGTTHGGIALPDGTIKKVALDFDTLEKLSNMAREEYSLGGAVQHGASTLPDDMFDIFPRIGTLEVHLATGFQNIIFDSPNFPKRLLDDIHTGLTAKYGIDRKSTETDSQFIYGTRKRAFGDFKKEIWNMPAQNLTLIGQELEDRFTMLFHKLNVINTMDIIYKVISKT